MPRSIRLRGEAYWTQLFEDVYSKLESRDTTAYQFSPSDRWTQGRTSGWSAHLQAWVAVDGVSAFDSDTIRQAAVLYFAVRYNADDDSVSQARMNAALHDAMEFLIGYLGPYGIRVASIDGAQFIGDKASTYITAEIDFTFSIPR